MHAYAYAQFNLIVYVCPMSINNIAMNMYAPGDHTTAQLNSNSRGGCMNSNAACDDDHCLRAHRCIKTIARGGTALAEMEKTLTGIRGASTGSRRGGGGN